MRHRNEVLRFNRPTDKKLEEYKSYALEFFECLHDSFPEVGGYFDTAAEGLEGKARRDEAGGHLLFRPIGLEIIAANYCTLKRTRRLDKAEICRLFSELPVSLSEEPYCGLLWNPRKKLIISKSKAVTKHLVGYMLGNEAGEADLLADYRRAIEGVEDADARELPGQVA